MIISRTPFRVSFVGGGTDLKPFYSREEGRVLSATINRYIYVAVKRQLGITEHKFRVNWSRVEFKDRIEDIEHPIVRESLKLMKIDFPIEISTFADVPSNTGLGSSSAFTVGLLHALFALKGEMVTKATLARLAGEIEVDILGRSMGKQDHYAAAYGDLNVFTFRTNGEVSVEPVFYRPEIKQPLAEHLMLFYTTLKRDVSDVLKPQMQKIPEKFETLKKMRDLVDPLRRVMSNGADLNELGKILHKNWMLKRSITPEISSPAIDGYYDRALKAGAVGGKLLGAGGGGFMLFYVEPDKQAAVRKSLSDLYYLTFRLDNAGSRITYYDQNLP